ncbi:MAG: hypothetical protein U0263_24460 [Polyangiaceae bacterium]
MTSVVPGVIAGSVGVGMASGSASGVSVAPVTVPRFTRSFVRTSPSTVPARRTRTRFALTVPCTTASTPTTSSAESARTAPGAASMTAAFPVVTPPPSCQSEFSATSASLGHTPAPPLTQVGSTEIG